MHLVVQDRGNGEEWRINNMPEIVDATLRVAKLLNRPVDQVREDLVRGISVTTPGFVYRMIVD